MRIHARHRDRRICTQYPQPLEHLQDTFVCRLFYGGSAKYISTARVLYADGGIESISREEAERLVTELSPVPIEFYPEPETKEEAE